MTSAFSNVVYRSRCTNVVSGQGMRTEGKDGKYNAKIVMYVSVREMKEKRDWEREKNDEDDEKVTHCGIHSNAVDHTAAVQSVQSSTVIIKW